MKKILILIVLFQISLITIIKGENEINRKLDVSVWIAPNGISVPFGRIILIRENDKYGAVKFIKCWTKRIPILSLIQKDEVDTFASYESYYQGDGSGNFSKTNVIIKKEEVSDIKRPSLINPGHLFQKGHPYVTCGKIELFWTGDDDHCLLYFYKFDTYSNDTKVIQDRAFAPTKWTQIYEVNVFDPRLKWYKYGELKKSLVIPIDKLWEEDTTKLGSNKVE